ncbi:MAG: family 43 glycosylhydrolase [Polyangiales bacterium]
MDARLLIAFDMISTQELRSAAWWSLVVLAASALVSCTSARRSSGLTAIDAGGAVAVLAMQDGGNAGARASSVVPNGLGVGGTIGSAGGVGGVSGAGMGGAPSAGGGGDNAGGGAGSPLAGAGGGTAGAAGSPSCMAPVPGSKGANPLFTDQYTADPAALVYDCTFYIQCGHDEGTTGFVMKEWFLLASTDMVHWTKNVALRLSDFAWADANAWAGQMVVKNGKFYWFVPVNERGSGMALGVAVADSPTGPFKDAIGKALVDDAFEMSNMGFSTPSDTPYTIDPTVFVDDDGQAYLHYGGFGRLVVAKLSDDMLSISGKMKEVTPQGFFEAPYLIKRNGTYYEIYAAGQNPATIDYATSTSPLGPWKYGGRILDALPNAPGQDAATNHSGVAEFAGQWYIVYHVSNGPNAGGTYRREVSIDELTFNPDGSIPKVVPSSGLHF